MLNSSVQKIKDRLGIEEVVSSYLKLERAGSSLKAKCPFHNEKTPSFFVSPDRGSYYCFGCGASGDIFTFVEEFEGLDFKGALKLLAERAGVELVPLTRERKEAESEKERLYKIMEEAALYFEDNLKSNEKALQYLKSRGLLDKTIKEFRIGYAMPDWRKLYDHLRSRNFSDIEIERAGLAKKPEEKNKNMYDRFRGRIVFPICDTSGRVIAFSGRILEDDGKSAKYLNSPDTPIFKKSSVLFGLDKAKGAIKKNDFSIVVEGQFDLILSHQAGFRNTVATSGTALTDSGMTGGVVNNLGLLSRLSQNVVFVFDSDRAGFNASIRATPIAMALFKDMNVKASLVPEGKDPAELIKEKGTEVWKQVIRNAKHIIEFLVDKYILISDNKDRLKTKLEIEEKIIPFLALIESPVKKSHFISLVSERSGISEEDIRVKLEKVELEFNKEKEEIKAVEKTSNIVSRKDYIGQRLLGIALWQKSQREPVIDWEKIIEKVGKKEIGNIKGDLIFEAEALYSNNVGLEKDVEEMLSRLEEEEINEELVQKMRELHRNKGGGIELLLIQQINELNKKKESIKNGRKK